MKRIIQILSFIFLLVSSTTRAQTFYDLNTVQKIEISFTQANWDYQMDTAKAGAQGYLMAQWVKINGVEYDSVGVKYKGNSSYDSTRIKNPLHINLKKYKSQTHQGYTDIKLANCYQDPSMIREVLAYNILANYTDCPKSNFAQVYINGSYVGLYSNDQDINKKFVTDHFYSYSANSNSFIKCSHDNPSPNTKTNLKYLGTDSTLYFSLYELQSNVGWKDLVNLCDTVTNYVSSISHYMDVDRAIWMLAFDNLLVNLDSYEGLLCQNYYLYKDNTSRFNPIVWDLNMAFGGFPFAGSQGGGTGSLLLNDMTQLSPALHATDADWPLIKAIMSNAQYKRMYIAHMRTMLNEIFANNSYQTLASQMQSIVDTAVQSDVNKFFSYAQFQNGLTGNVIAGSYTIPGITNLMSARISYLQGTADFTATPPAISLVEQSTITNNAVTVRAAVTNATTVLLGYRLDSTQKFEQVTMYDDGAHGDGGANDHVYGAAISTVTYKGQYYVYAENANAGMFSPQRAEHEFYRVSATAGLSGMEQNTALEVYPNPTSDQITIKANLQKAIIAVRNITGQNVYTGTIDKQLSINTASWPAGVYWLSANNVQTKFVVMH